MILVYILIFMLVIDFGIWIFNIYKGKVKNLDSLALQDLFFNKFIFLMPAIPILLISMTLKNLNMFYIEVGWLILNELISIMFKLKRLFKRVEYEATPQS